MNADTEKPEASGQKPEHALIRDARTCYLLRSLSPREQVEGRLLGLVKFYATRNGGLPAEDNLARIREALEAVDEAVSILEARHAAARKGGQA